MPSRNLPSHLFICFTCLASRTSQVSKSQAAIMCYMKSPHYLLSVCCLGIHWMSPISYPVRNIRELFSSLQYSYFITFSISCPSASYSQVFSLAFILDNEIPTVDISSIVLSEQLDHEEHVFNSESWALCTQCNCIKM